MWWNDVAAGIMRTANRLVSLRDIILKTDDTGVLHVRNSDNTAYAKVSALGVQIAGGDAGFYEDTTLWGWEVDATTGTAPALVILTSEIFNGYGSQGSGAVNDSRSWNVFLQPGSHHIEITHITGTNSGIVTLTIYKPDGTVLTSFTSFDAYTASNIVNVRLTLANFSVAQGGVHTMTAQILSKNASSSGFSWLVGKIRVWKYQD